MVYRGKRRKKKKGERLRATRRLYWSPRSATPHTRLQVDSQSTRVRARTPVQRLSFTAPLLFPSLSRHKYIYAPPVSTREIHVYLSWRIERGSNARAIMLAIEARDLRFRRKRTTERRMSVRSNGRCRGEPFTELRWTRITLPVGGTCARSQRASRSTRSSPERTRGACGSDNGVSVVPLPCT